MRINISKKAALGLALAGAVLLGGAGTAVVSAAIPSSSDHKIHACYRNAAGLTDAKGTLRVVDSDAGTNCTTQETALNWDQLSAPAATPVAYAHFTSHYDSETQSDVPDFDSARSNGVTLLSLTSTAACLKADFDPKNIQMTGGASFAPQVAIKTPGLDTTRNGWTSDRGNQECQAVSGANIYADPGQEAWITVTRF